MRAYADSSFIVRLVTNDLDSIAAIDEYRRLRLPALLFLPLHGLEVRNSIHQRAYHQRRSMPSRDHPQIARIRDAALARIELFLKRRAFLEVSIDSDALFQRAGELAERHTEKLGARAIDILHVASALLLESELFLTADRIQGALAAKEGLKVAGI